jgi:hypothetical protein
MGEMSMANHYTDVDLMILNRWDEVRALRKAFDEVVGRMSRVVESTLKRVVASASEQGFSAEYDPKRPAIWFWKQDWEVRRRKTAAIYFWLADFVPFEYGREVEDHPQLWLITEDFPKLRMEESGEDFGRAIKTELSPELLAEWNHEDADLSNSPLGKECTNVPESDRVRFVAEPEKLHKFVLERLEEFKRLVPAVDQALQKMTRR